jgi:DegV family protein with EDD domain
VEAILSTVKRRCNILLDSCCDLPGELIQSLGVEILEFPFIMDDGEHFDDLGVTMSAHDFYERLRKGEQVYTAQVPYAVLLEVFEKAAAQELPTVYLGFSSGLSGTLENAQLACAETLARHPGAEIYVVDTLLASVAEGLLVWEAVRQADRGLSATELVAWVEEARFFINAYFTLPDMETLRRGGRIPDMVAFAGAKLDIKPLISFDLSGHLCFQGAARGRKKAIKQMLGLYQERVQEHGTERVVVASSDAPKELKTTEEQLLKLCGDKAPTLYPMSVGPVIGAHTGPDLLAVVFWGPDRRKELSLGDRIASLVSGRKHDETPGEE